MGTRGLTAVIVDGEHKIAQYGQWDHYPSGQGLTVLAFCREVMADDAKRAAFLANLRRCRFETTADVAERDAWLASIGVSNGWLNTAQHEQWKKRYPLHTRDHGAEILGMVAAADGSDTIVLQDSWGFGADSLFCEWAYVIDATAGTLEVYRGFNERPATATGRFAAMKPERDNGFAPITLAKTYRIGALPADSEFVEELEKIANRRQPIPRLSDAGIGATDAPTIARVLGCETSLVRRAVDTLAVSDPSHGAAQARAIEWAADSETRIAKVAARVLAEGGGALEIAREIVAIGGRVAP